MEFGSLMAHLIDTGHIYLQDFCRCMQLQLAYYFGDLQLARSMYVDSQNTEKTCLGQPIVYRRAFFAGLTAYALAREAALIGGKAKIRAGGATLKELKREGNGFLSKLRGWVKGGNVNCVHLYSLLEAESFSLERDNSKNRHSTEAAYDASIVTSSRSGFVHDQALTYELAADYLIRVGDTTGDNKLGHYQQQALTAYQEYGAAAKVLHLRQKWSLEIDSTGRWHSVLIKAKS